MHLKRQSCRHSDFACGLHNNSSLILELSAQNRKTYSVSVILQKMATMAARPIKENGPARKKLKSKLDLADKLFSDSADRVKQADFLLPIEAGYDICLCCM